MSVALVVAAVAGGVLSRSLLQSGASRESAAQASVVVLFNRQRAARGLASLSVDPKLVRAADSHSADMLRRGYFAHSGPQGAWDTRIRHYVKRALIAEILSFGSGPTRRRAAW